MKFIIFGDRNILIGLRTDDSFLPGESMFYDKDLQQAINSITPLSFTMYNGRIFPVVNLGNSDLVEKVDDKTLASSAEERKAYEDMVSYSVSGKKYDIVPYVKDNPQLYAEVFRINSSLSMPSSMMNYSVQNKATDYLSFPIPSFYDIKGGNYDYPNLNFFKSLPKSLRTPKFMKNLASTNHVLEEVIGFEENDKLEIQDNEKDVYEALKNIIKQELVELSTKKNISVDKLIEDGIKPRITSNFIYHMCLYALLKNRCHTGFIYLIEDMDVDNDRTDDDEETVGTKQEINDGKRYFEKELPITSIPDSGLVLQNYVERCPSSFAWAETLIKLLRWGERKPQCLFLEEEDTKLNLNTFELEDVVKLQYTEYKDQDGNNRFPKYLLKGETCLQSYDNIPHDHRNFFPIVGPSGVEVFPLGLVCSDYYVASNGVQKEQERYIDYFTIVESLLEDNGIKVSGISLVDGKVKVDESINNLKAMVFKEPKDYETFLSLAKDEKSDINIDVSNEFAKIVMQYGTIPSYNQSFIFLYYLLLVSRAGKSMEQIRKAARQIKSPEDLERVKTSKGMFVSGLIINNLAVEEQMLEWYGSSVEDILNITLLYVKTIKGMPLEETNENITEKTTEENRVDDNANKSDSFVNIENSTNDNKVNNNEVPQKEAEENNAENNNVEGNKIEDNELDEEKDIEDSLAGIGLEDLGLTPEVSPIIYKDSVYGYIDKDNNYALYELGEDVKVTKAPVKGIYLLHYLELALKGNPEFKDFDRDKAKRIAAPFAKQLLMELKSKKNS